MQPSSLVKLSRILTLISYFALFSLIVFGIVSEKLYPEQPRFYLIIGILMPLIFPARGILRAKRYTHSWTSYISLYYLIIATDLWVMKNYSFSIAYFITALGLFFGCVLYARFSPLPWKESSQKTS